MSIPSVRAELAVDARAMIGEGPTWDERNGRLLWVDIRAGLVHAFHPGKGASEPVALGQPVGAAVLRKDGGMVAALRDGFGFVGPGASSADRVIEVERDRPQSRMNDGKVDCRGRFWAGTMAIDHTPGQGTLYRLEVRPDGAAEVTPMVGGITIANGLDWSPDNRTLYYIDSATQRIDRFAFDCDTGRLGDRRPLIDVPAHEGLPDGMTVDAEGHIWVALFGAGRIRRYAPDGTIGMEIVLPVSLVTSCAFGGPGLDELYITTARHRLTAQQAADQVIAGGLFVCRPGPIGRAPFLFG